MIMRSVVSFTSVALVFIATLGSYFLPQHSPIHEMTPHTPTPSFNSIIRNNFLNLLTINEECLFPCWQGLVLGESSINDATEFGSAVFLDEGSRRTPFGAFQEYEQDFYFDYSSGVIADGTTVNLSFFTKNDDQLSAIYVYYLGYDTSTGTKALPNSYDIRSVIEAYGFPDEVWLRGYQNTTIALLFRTLGLLISYSYVETSPEIADNLRTICPNNFHGFSLFAYLPENIASIPYLVTGLKKLDATSAISPEDFLGLIVERNPTCVETPESIWTTP